MSQSGAVTVLVVTMLVWPTGGLQAQREAGRTADTLHGVQVRDRFRWLEDYTSPESRQWVREQDRIARATLGTVPKRRATQQQVADAASARVFSAPVKEGGKYFFTRTAAIGPQVGAAVFVRDSATGNMRELVPDGGATRRMYPSPDGRLVAVGVAIENTEWEAIRLVSVADGSQLSDSVTGLFRWSAASWSRAPDRPGFYYTRFRVPSGGVSAGRPQESGAVYFHRVGTQQSADELVFEMKDTSIVTPIPRVSDDGRFLLVTVRRGTSRASRVFARDLAAGGGFVEAVPKDGANYVILGTHGSHLWVATDSGAPRGRVIDVDMSTAPARRSTLVPEGRDAIDNWSYGAATGGQLFVWYRRDAVLEGAVFAPDGTLRRRVEIPGKGSVWSGIVGKSTDPEAFLVVQGVADPGTVYRFDATTGAMNVFVRSTFAYDPEQFVTEQVFYKASDGARIPMYVVRARTTALNATAPLWIYGYGAQRWTAAPWFQPEVAAWLLNGGVWAVPNIRGGAEYGEEWFTAGSRRNKQRGIDDYVDAVRWLVTNRYVAPHRLVAHGTSAGGVLVAAAATQNPSLFAAVILEYPMIDIMRYEHLLTGNRWSDDYGTISDAGDFKAMHAYAPLQNLRPGTCYPAMLVAPGEVDQTAAPAHAFKFVAAAQVSQGCPGNPIMLRVSWGTGHNSGATVTDAIENWTDQLAFVERAFRAQLPKP